MSCFLGECNLLPFQDFKKLENKVFTYSASTNIVNTSRCVKFSENRMLFCIAHGLACLLGRRVSPKGMRRTGEEGA